MWTLPSALLYFFVIINHHDDGISWREAPDMRYGYTSYAACVEGQAEYRMNDEPGVFSECYARRVVRANGK